MRRRWYYYRQMLRANRPLLFLSVFLMIGVFFMIRGRQGIAGQFGEWFRTYGVQAAGGVMKEWFPAVAGEEEGYVLLRAAGENQLFSYLEELSAGQEYSEDPAYEKLLAEAWEERQRQNGAAEGIGGSQSGGSGAGGAGSGAAGSQSSESGSGGAGSGQADSTGAGNVGGSQSSGAGASGAGDGQSGSTDIEAGEAIALKPAGSYVIREKLADYDYLMGTFYSVHPTTTAGRDLMNAARFLAMDFSLDQEAEGPQILIYHTHSQEEFSDYLENPEATIVGVGTYLTELLEAKGYQVIHDTRVYDIRDGKLDRSQAYTYALDGISGILQKYPSIEVVIDLHRDGVAEGTRLVTEVNGKPTAQIMLFNGLSQTPDGPIEYLQNPNREANLGFSFQLQLAAAERYPGFTRKIYLKGLRYNQHVRARTALVEVGAQTNTCEEARNAMEPLSEILDQVLRGQQ